MTNSASAIRLAECGHLLGDRSVFRVRAPAGELIVCLMCALRNKYILRRSLLACVVVGTVLLSINQGDTLFVGEWSAPLAWKIPLTYLTPFIVATWGTITGARRAG